MDSPLIRRRQAIGLLAGTLAGVAWGAEDTDAGTASIFMFTEPACGMA